MTVLQLFLVLAIICVFFCISPLICTVFIFGGMFLYAVFRPEEKEEHNLVEVQLPPEEDEIMLASQDDEEDFPEPDLSFSGMVPDPHTCLAYVAEYEDLAERARNRGLEDLADRYDEAAAHWHNLYEEAEDEEMEW